MQRRKAVRKVANPGKQNVTTQDLALSLDMFSDRVLKPAIAAIANKVDYDGLSMAKASTANKIGRAHV